MVKVRLKPYSTGSPKQQMQTASAFVAISEMPCSFDRKKSDFHYTSAIRILPTQRLWRRYLVGFSVVVLSNCSFLWLRIKVYVFRTSSRLSAFFYIYIFQIKHKFCDFRYTSKTFVFFFPDFHFCLVFFVFPGTAYNF